MNKLVKMFFLFVWGVLQNNKNEWKRKKVSKANFVLDINIERKCRKQKGTWGQTRNWGLDHD